MAMWILGCVFAVIGLPFVWIARRVFARDRATASWPRAPGVVSNSQLESWEQQYRDRNGFYYDQTVYKPVVRYTYAVAGQVLDGTRIARAVDDVATGRAAAQRYVDAYPPQKQVMVLYDPSDPKIAYLEVRRSTGAVILFVFGCVWFAIGALLVALSFLT